MEKLTIEVDVKEVWHKLIAKKIDQYHDYSNWLEDKLKDRMTRDEQDEFDRQKEEWWKDK